MNAYFITATGTGVGKTYLTALLAKQHGARAIKPIISGFSQDEMTDTHLLSEATGEKNLDAISPWRFTAPLSPDVAAAREGKSIVFSELVDFCREAMAGAPLTLIEGVGGVMVPLNDTHTVLDLMAVLKLPVILVAGSYLGTISHTLTSLAVLRSRGVKIHTIVISESEESPMPMEETAATIERFTGIAPVLLPRGAGKIGLVL